MQTEVQRRLRLQTEAVVEGSSPGPRPVHKWRAMLISLANQLEDWQIRLAKRPQAGGRRWLRRRRGHKGQQPAQRKRAAPPTRTTSTSGRGRPPPATQQGRLPDPAGCRGGTHCCAERDGDRHYVKSERVTSAQFLLDEWLPSRRPPVLEESTWKSYDRYIRLHVVPHVGGIPCSGSPRSTSTSCTANYSRPAGAHLARRPADAPAVQERATELRATGLSYEQVASALRTEFEAERDITKHAVAALLRRSRAEAAEPPGGLSPRTVRYIHTIIHAALKDALRWNRVVRNVADAATPPSAASARSQRPKAWTTEQLRAFLDSLPTAATAGVDLPRHTGCRRGECLGLRWDDVDLDAGTAVISRQVTAIDHRGDREGTPKTKRAHLIRLDRGTIGDAPRLRVEQAEDEAPRSVPATTTRASCSAQWDGTPYHPERFSREFDRKRRYFNRDHPDKQLPPITLHGLRHTWATLALSAGIDIKIVSERLNHSSTHITREIYTHVTPPMQSDAAERVAGLILRG